MKNKLQPAKPDLGTLVKACLTHPQDPLYVSQAGEIQDEETRDSVAFLHLMVPTNLIRGYFESKSITPKSKDHLPDASIFWKNISPYLKDKSLQPRNGRVKSHSYRTVDQVINAIADGEQEFLAHFRKTVPSYVLLDVQEGRSISTDDFFDDDATQDNDYE